MNMMNTQSQTPLPTRSVDWESQEVEETTASPQDEGVEAGNTDSEDGNTILLVILTISGCLLCILIVIVIVTIYRKRWYKQGMQRLRNIDSDDETDDEQLAINTDGI